MDIDAISQWAGGILVERIDVIWMYRENLQ